MPQINYWERKKSFWSTPKGIIIEIAAILILLGGAILALNMFSSPYPVIEYFKANPVTIMPGESSTLSWSVVGAESLIIDQGIGMVELNGQRKVMPAETTIYTLSAMNGTKNRSASVRVLVEK
ncbi:MAG TPA: hypothetical protein VN455_07075 [Methanotrichaceae archaeon]|nr:hypothetical protein [Methanotrichaceae archaeon]